MISQDFKIDFDHKKIYYSQAGSGAVYTLNELYSYLQDIFDELENMTYQVPIRAESQTTYLLTNGWTIDTKSRNFLKDGTLKVSAA